MERCWTNEQQRYAGTLQCAGRDTPKYQARESAATVRRHGDHTSLFLAATSAIETSGFATSTRVRA